MASVFSAEEQLTFLVKLQRLLHEGSFVATYKYALLLAIADVCVEDGDDSGHALRVPTSALAERFIRYYWKQVLPFHGPDDVEKVLHQKTGTQASIVDAVASAHLMYQGSIVKLRANAAAWGALRHKVEETITKMPLWKLQNVGGHMMEFLYPNVGSGNEIELYPGVAYCFRKFYEMIEDLVRGAWIRFVRELPANRPVLGHSTELSSFLFGATRAEVDAAREVLLQVQGQQCFYCEQTMLKTPVVDHFIPWSLYPADLGHNYVLAHAKCNGFKADRLAAVDHLRRWRLRNDRVGDELTARFTKSGVMHDLEVTRSIARWAYGQASNASAQVWVRGKNLIPLLPGWRQAIDAA